MDLSRYVKRYAQEIAKELAEKWSEETASELFKTLGDYFASKKAKLEEKPKRVFPKKVFQLRDCLSNRIYQELFELALEATKLGQKSVFITAHSMGADEEKLKNALLNINGSKFMREKYPECTVTSIRKENGWEVRFNRKELN